MQQTADALCLSMVTVAKIFKDEVVTIQANIVQSMKSA